MGAPMTYIIAYAAALLFFLAVDLPWIAFVMKDFYKAQIGHLMAGQPKLIWAGGFYLAYVVGVVVFAVRPGLEQGWITAFLYGALLGAIAYGTYDMTNLATLKDWPLTMTIVDICWGAVLTGSTAAFATAVTNAIRS